MISRTHRAQCSSQGVSVCVCVSIRARTIVCIPLTFRHHLRPVARCLTVPHLLERSIESGRGAAMPTFLVVMRTFGGQNCCDDCIVVVDLFFICVRPLVVYIFCAVWFSGVSRLVVLCFVWLCMMIYSTVNPSAQ